MKVLKNKLYLYLFFIFQNLIFVLSDNAQDKTCLGNILNSLFSAPVADATDMCSIKSGSKYKYKGLCNSDQTLIALNITSLQQGTPGLTYTNLKCFTNTFDELILTNITLNNNAIGTDDDIKVVAKNVYLNTCIYDSELFSNGKSTSKETETLSIMVNKYSNLNYFRFESFKNTKNIYLLNENGMDTNFPIVMNGLQNSTYQFDTIAIDTNALPSFKNTTCKNVQLSLKEASSTQGTTSLGNLDTFEKTENLILFFDEKIFYPTELSSSNNNLKSLMLVGELETPAVGGYSIQNNLEKFQIISPGNNFNIDGSLPFNIYPTTLKLFKITNSGVSIFPSNFPSGIESIDLSNNQFSGNLPDLSSYTKLQNVKLNGCQFSGPIPDHYCAFMPILSDNKLNGTLPQCFSCFVGAYTNNNFNNNEDLVNNVCEPGSVVPNIEYIPNNSLTLYGKNLGLYSPSFSTPTKNFVFDVVKPQSLFINYISKDTYISDIVTVTLPYYSTTFYMATKELVPNIKNISNPNLNNEFIFIGENFSYNTSDIIIMVNNTQCNISYIDFNTIECKFIPTLQPSTKEYGTIQNIKSNRVYSFSINTISGTNSTEMCDINCVNGGCESDRCICNAGYIGFYCDLVSQCPFDCGESNGHGKCNSSKGYCDCTIYYTGHSCSIPNQFLSSVTSTPSSGGVVNLYGWFGSTNNFFNISIGGIKCEHHYINETFANCTIPSGSGTKSVSIYQNDILYTASNVFHYTELNYKCPKDCSGNGQCITSTGQCKCSPGWGGYDCNSKTAINQGSTTSDGGNTSPNDLPSSNTSINETSGSTTINNQQTSFDISILSLVELDILNNMVKEYNLTNKWNGITNSNNIYTFTQTIQQSCSIIYSIEEVKETRDYQFAGLNLTLDKDSIKISVSIQNYTFSNALNQLQLRIQSKVGDNGESFSNNECNNQDILIDKDLIDKSQLLNYLTISKNQKTLYGRFINRVLSDSRETFITTEVISNTTSIVNDKESFIIGLNLPHCTTECLIDPDFSVLVSNQYKKCSSDGRPSWVLPVAIVIPCVVVVAIVIISSILYKRNRTTILLAKNKLNNIRLKKK